MQRFSWKFHSKNMKPTNHRANSTKNKPKSYLHRYPTLENQQHRCKRAFCAPSWQIHADLSDQHYTCCTFLSLANQRSMPHVRHLRLKRAPLNHYLHIPLHLLRLRRLQALVYQVNTVSELVMSQHTCKFSKHILVLITHLRPSSLLNSSRLP